MCQGPEVGSSLTYKRMGPVEISEWSQSGEGWGWGETRQGIDHAICATAGISEFVQRTARRQWRVLGRGSHGLTGSKSGFWVESG